MTRRTRAQTPPAIGAASIERIAAIAEKAKAGVASVKDTYQPHAQAKAIASIRQRAWAEVLGIVESLEKPLIGAIEDFDAINVAPPLTLDSAAIASAVSDARTMLFAIPDRGEKIDAIYSTTAAMNESDEARHAADICVRAVTRLQGLGVRALLGPDANAIAEDYRQFVRALRSPDAWLNRLAAIAGLSSALGVLGVVAESLGGLHSELQAARTERAERIASLSQ